LIFDLSFVLASKINADIKYFVIERTDSPHPFYVLPWKTTLATRHSLEIVASHLGRCKQVDHESKTRLEREGEPQSLGCSVFLGQGKVRRAASKCTSTSPDPQTQAFSEGCIVQ
jgi:hypothetical protein